MEQRASSPAPSLNDATPQAVAALARVASPRPAASHLQQVRAAPASAADAIGRWLTSRARAEPLRSAQLTAAPPPAAPPTVIQDEVELTKVRLATARPAL